MPHGPLLSEVLNRVQCSPMRILPNAASRPDALDGD